MSLGIPRRLFLKLAGSVVAAFVLTLTLTGAVLFFQSGRNAEKLMQREFADVRDEVEERIDRRLISVAIEAREQLADTPDRSVEAMRRLAGGLCIDEICVVGADGVIETSNVDDYVGFDFKTAEGPAKEFLRLLTTDIEFAQAVRPNSHGGKPMKYVGVWLPEGGFVQIGCSLKTVGRLSQTTVSGVTHNKHLGGIGEVIVTTPGGQVLSSARDTAREGSMFEPPGEDVYWMKEEIGGFPVHLLYPKSEVAHDRRVFLGIVALLTIGTLVFVAILVAVAIAGFVREQIEKRLAADMAMAASIQASSLPRVFPPYPALVKNFDIHAVMRPAKEVGGDFYDFYHTGPDTFCLVIADVSGKGVPAALFMMKAKTTLKSTLSGGVELAEAVRRVNDALSEGNDDNLFVTAWIGIVNLKTGRVKYVNAGHNPPFVKSASGEIRALDESPDLPLAALGDFPYQAHETRLERGETILLYTDGITEAMDRESRLFGDGRLKAAFAGDTGSAESVCRTIVSLTDAFAAGAPQADDMTLLVYRFLSPTKDSLKASFPPSLEALAECGRMIEAAKLGPNAAIILDEIASNIVRCSGATEFLFEITPERELVFWDNGTPFDPTAVAAPDVTLAAEDRAVGGLGIFLVKELSTSVTYRREDGWNVLTVRL